MDDLDRLYDRLADNVREGFPHLNDRAFQLGDIAEHLVPYRLNRRELGFDSVRQYEVALMRLASGEGGHLRADAAVQDAFRRTLATPEPDASLLRDHARASVALSTERQAAAPPPPAPPAAAPDAAPETPADMFGITPATFGIPTPSWSEPAPARETPPPPLDPVPRAEPLTPRPGPTVIGGPCRYCGQRLPDGRPVTFCPHCGQNVTVQQCPACSTELEVGWAFCITCGRAMADDAAVPATP